MAKRKSKRSKRSKGSKGSRKPKNPKRNKKAPSAEVVAESRAVNKNEEEILPLQVDEVVEVLSREEEDVGVMLVETKSEADTATVEKVKLFEHDVLVDRIEGEGKKRRGKSFRSKDLTEADLSKGESALTLEEQWIEDEDSVTGGSWINRFVILGLLLAITAGVWAFSNLGGEEIAKEERNRERERELKELALATARDEAELAARKASVIESVKGYLEAKTIEERSKWSRNSEGVLHKMTQHYTSDQPFDSYRFEDLGKISEFEINGKKLILLPIIMSRSDGETVGKKRVRSLMLEKQEDGTYRVDWETAVVFQPHDWDAFVVSRSNDPSSFRVDVRDRNRSGPYLYNYRSDDEYQAYRVSMRKDEEKYLVAYAKKNSEIDLKIKKVLREAKRRSWKRSAKRKSKLGVHRPMMLKLVFPPDAESGQCVEIVEIISDSWFLP